jgi:hypothetical protein
MPLTELIASTNPITFITQEWFFQIVQCLWRKIWQPAD